MHDNLVTPYANSLEKSFNALMELNMNTVQRFFSSHEDLMKIRHPEEFLEKTVGIMVEHSQKNIEYVQDFFQIFESHMLSVSLNNTKQSVKRVGKDLITAASSISIPVQTVKRSKKIKSRSQGAQKQMMATSLNVTQKSGSKSRKASPNKSTRSSVVTKSGNKSKSTITN